MEVWSRQHRATSLPGGLPLSLDQYGFIGSGSYLLISKQELGGVRQVGAGYLLFGWAGILAAISNWRCRLDVARIPQKTGVVYLDTVIFSVVCGILTTDGNDFSGISRIHP
jgi:hypothetical protein